MSEPIASIVVASPTRSSIALDGYVNNEKEGQEKGDRNVAISGINGCIPEVAEKQRRDNRKRWGKNGTRTVRNGFGNLTTEGEYVQAYHVIRSHAREGLGALDPENPEDIATAHELDVAFARKLAGKNRYATVHTQIDGRTGCIHSHIVIDSIDKVTGKSFDSSHVKHKLLAATSDAQLAEAGYEQVNTLDRGAEKLEKSELRALAKYQSWEADGRPGAEPFSVAVLKRRIRDALASETFTSWEGFEETALDLGVDVEQRGEKGRGISYAMLRDDGSEDFLPISNSDKRKASTLGRDYMMDAVERAIQRNLALHAKPVPVVKTKATTAPEGKVTPAPVAKPVTEPRQPTWEEKTAAMFAEIDAQNAAKPSASAEILRRAGLGQKSVEPAVAGDEAAPAAVQSTEDRPAEATVVAIHREAMDELSPQDVERGRVDEVALALPFRDEGNDGESSAPAPDYRRVPASAAAPAATSKPKKYRSPLRSVVVKSEQTQAVIDQVAPFDEGGREVLLRGDRIDESTVPKGIGPQFLKNYGDDLDPGVLEQLQLREKKKRHASRLHELGLLDERDALRAEIRSGIYEQLTTRRSLMPLSGAVPGPQMAKRDGLGG